MQTKSIRILVIVMLCPAFWNAVPLVAQDLEKGLPARQNAEVPKETSDRPMSYWMAKKLEHSKSLIEHLTKGDFDSLQRDAERLRLLGKLEGFVRRKNEDYRTQLRTFDVSTAELVRQARRKNIEGAALAFNQLTTSCVACHLLIREGVE